MANENIAQKNKRGPSIIWLIILAFNISLGVPSVFFVIQITFENYRLSPEIDRLFVAATPYTTWVFSLISQPLYRVTDLLNNWFDLSLTLHLHWIPIYILQVIYFLSYSHARGFSNEFLTFTIPVLTAYPIGLLPIDGPWWVQGIIAMSLVISMIILPLIFGLVNRFGALFRMLFVWFVAGASAHFLDVLNGKSGLLVLLASVIFYTFMNSSSAKLKNGVHNFINYIFVGSHLFIAAIVLALDLYFKSAL
ncbi:MAG: hypothetical protein KIS81_11985 [Maricaulaceae bacterium]|nr:hypothetical protein [Maricaulaceae bacterium]